jgi:putative ABC transport system permease protein
VGIGREYFEKQSLSPSAGTLPLVMGDVVLGATMAADLGLGPGDALFSDQRELYDIAKPPALRMRVCGVLARKGTPDDDAAFVDLKTTWILEGVAHGHIEATSVDESLVIGEAKGQIVLSPALIESNEVTGENLASFHVHADETGLPLTSILFYPNDQRAATIVRSRVNRSDAYQMVSASVVVEELLAYVFRVKALLDSLAAVLGACTVVLTGLVVALSLRLRARELEALHRIGCSRWTTVRLVGAELAVVLLLSAGLAAAGVAVAGVIVGDAVWVIG